MSPFAARHARARRVFVPILLPATLASLGLAHSAAAQGGPRFRFENAPVSHDLNGGAFGDGIACFPLDLDNDGDSDLVRLRGNSLDVGTNDGGQLTLTASYDPSMSGGTGFDFLPADAAKGDFDGDGFEDVVLAGLRQAFPNGRAAQLLLNDHNGGFLPQALEPLPWGDAQYPAVEVADLDGDGRDDRVFWLSFGAEMHILISGAPSGTTLSLPASTRELRLGDVNGDAKPDLLALHYTAPQTGSVLVRLNDGAGGFPGAGTSFGALQEPWGLEAIDCDQDGDLDALTTEGAAAFAVGRFTDLMVLPNDGSGALGAAVRSHVSTDDWWPMRSAEAGMLDDDGVLDLAFAAEHSSGGVIATARGIGGGAFELMSAVAEAVRDIALDDLTGTGQPKVLTAEGGVLPIDGLGRVGPTAADGGFGPQEFVLVDVLDFDGDGRSDLLQHDGTQTVSVRVSDGEGGFAAPVVLGNTGVPYAQFLDAVELDGDGRLDAALIVGDRVIAVLSPGGAAVTSTFPAGCPDTPRGRAWGDLDGDGASDVIVSPRRQLTGVVGMGVGDGSFVSSCFTFPDATEQLELADVDGDSKLDLVFVGYSAGLWIVPGRGDGTFDPGVSKSFGVGLAPRLTTGDVDGDGDVDVIAARDGRGFVVLHNDGSGNLALAQTVDSTAGYERMLLADLDEDGRVDVVAQCEGAVSLDLFANLGGTFARSTPRIEVADGQHWSSATLAAGDLDGDLLSDLVVAGAFEHSDVGNPLVFFNRTQLSADGLARPGESLRLLLSEPRAAGRPYMLLGSRFGTQPGAALPGDVLPLNFDPYLWIAFRADPVTFAGFAGTLDAFGRAQATLHVPPSLSLPGALPLDFAFLTLDASRPAVIASNELGVTLR